MSTLPLPTVGSLRRKPGVTFAANTLVAIILLGQHGKRRIVNSSTQAKDQVESTLLLDVIVAQCAAIFALFSREDETLLIRGDSFLVLDFGLDIIDGVGGLDIEGDCFAR